MPQGDLGFVGVTPVSKSAALSLVDHVYQIPARGTAGTDAETVLGPVATPGSGAARNPMQLDSVTLFPGADIAGDATNYVTAKLYNRKGDGTGTDVLATLAFNTGSHTYGKYVPLTFTIDGSKAGPVSGDVLTLSIEHASNGLATPQLALRIRTRG